MPPSRPAGRLPAGGLWRGLTTWNVLEFKGPTVSPRDEDLDALIEVGLGIHRRLNEERAKEGQPALGRQDVSFWFLAHRLGRRLRSGWELLVPGLQLHSPGVWRGEVLGRPLFLVSGRQLPVEEASLPLHLVARQPAETERAVARLVAGRADLWERYGGWLASLHPAAYGEVEGMARQTTKPLRLDLTPIVRTMGMDWVVEQLGARRVVEHLGAKRVVEELGLRRVVDELGGVKRLLADLSPEQRRELKQKMFGE